MRSYYEDEKTELKKELIDEVKSEIVAFLNSEGGTVFVGVEDDGTVIGFKDSNNESPRPKGRGIRAFGSPSCIDFGSSAKI